MGDLYVKCPRCDGRSQVYAYTRLPRLGEPARGEYFTCPLCYGTGEAEKAAAEEFALMHAEENEDAE
jgi:hypothetical protein